MTSALSYVASRLFSSGARENISSALEPDTNNGGAAAAVPDQLSPSSSNEDIFAEVENISSKSSTDKNEEEDEVKEKVGKTRRAKNPHLDRCEIQDIGCITKLNGRHKGVIAQKYTFYPTEFEHGDIKFKFGDKVSFTARQVGALFHVTSMSHYVSPELLQQQELLDIRTSSCYIMRFDSQGRAILTGKDLATPLVIDANQLPKGYESKVGDWLSVKMKFEKPANGSESESIGTQILSVTATVSKTQQGKLQNIGQRDQPVWTINTNKAVYIHPELVKEKQLRSGVTVTVKMIECCKRLYCWRVVFIEISRKRNFLKFRDELADYVCRLTENKEGIIINSNDTMTHFGDIPVGGFKERSMHIENTSRTPKHLTKIFLNYDKIVTDFEFIVGSKECDEIIAVIKPDETISIKIRAKPKLIGETSELIIFEFGTGTNKFQIGRKLRVTGKPADDEMLNLLTANKRETGTAQPSQGRRNGRFDRNSEESREIKAYVYNKAADARKQLNTREKLAGGPVVRQAFFRRDKRMPSYQIPKNISEAYKENLAEKLFEELPSLAFDEEFLKSRPTSILLTPDNYRDCFQAGLWLEEIDNMVRNEKLTIEQAILYRTNDNVYYFNAANIEAGQVQLGNVVAIFDPNNPGGYNFETQIVRLSDNNVYVRPHEEFRRLYKDQPMTVKFRVARTTYRRWHYAACNAMKMLGKDWLFPEVVEVKPPRLIILEDETSFESYVNEVSSSDSGSGISDPEGNQEDQVDETVVVEKVEEAALPDEKKKQKLVQVRLQKLKLRTLTNRRNELDQRKTSVFPVRGSRLFGAAGVSDETKNGSEVKLIWFNTDLNDEQKEAVRRILRGQCRPLPFIIFGPPGTGKTVTMIEAIMQVNKLMKSSRILVTAPTNSAADLIAEYLVDSGKYSPGDFHRLLGFSRKLESVSKKIEAYCEDPCDLSNVVKSRLLITTTNSSGQLFELDLPEDHFSHVFIDEAGCCFEPDSLIPSMFVSISNHGQLIMAGDHKQLGPCVFSYNARFYGLGTSLLERLMVTELYTNSETKNILTANLLKNYRSHELILKIPSQLFYDDSLIAEVSKSEAEALLQKLNFLPVPQVPLIFRNHLTTEYQDNDSCSWYNPTEVQVVVDYLQKLLSCGIVASDIGIITPYKKQVEKIRMTIERQLRCELPKIGSVEVFQGAERKVIIVSLVRSIDWDEQTPFPSAKLGFVFSEKRMNVMLSRARCLQIVIGNTNLFSGSPLWYEYINHCNNLQVVEGSPLPYMFNSTLQKAFDAENQGENNEPPESEVENNYSAVEVDEDLEDDEDNDFF